jgi:hypothetical protein
VVLSGYPASSTTKTGRHEIAEILLKVALKHKKKKIKSNSTNSGARSEFTPNFHGVRVAHA